ncbi:MAG: AAA family ATPase [Bacteroidales bacterium]|nr:AAA family ATPase [Bacteroidales bacterium]
METRKYPVDTQTFSKIIEEGCVYIDKTDLVYKIANEYHYVFLSRPRRFGKSLLCSTLKEYFSGNKDLFKGLKIDGMEKEWEQYPIIHLDFSSCKTTDIKAIKKYLSVLLAKYEYQYSLISKKDFEKEIKGKVDVENISNVRLGNLVESIFKQTGKKVVIIIDEYDALMLNAIHDDDLQNKVREQQNNFFSPLKELDPYIRFLFITGITKFSQMSIFSTLNSLKDISLMPEFETLCGISHEEMLSVFKSDIQSFADKNGYTFEQTVRFLKFKYDGYNFSPEMRGVYNPYSLINAMCDKQLNDYWFNSGTPSALLKLINKFDIKMEDYEGVECGASRFNKPVEKVTDLVPFLFQAGYLTIKGYKTYDDEENVLQTYTLGYPNGEVRMAFANSLYTEYYKATENIPLRDAYIEFKINDDLDAFIEHLKVFFDGFPFSLNNMNEKHYHSILYTVLTSFGANISANQETALGKADLILRMPKVIYVIELKYDRSTESAKRQMSQRRYAKAFLDDNKRIVKLAIKFSSKKKNIVGYEAVEERIG